MLLALNRLDVPLSSPGWEDQVAGKLALDRSDESKESVTQGYLKAWTWAREAEKVALKRANSVAADSVEHMEAMRIAKRHSGVWRAANKMCKDDNHGNRKRTIVAVRADAGDSTCPSWLQRTAYNRIKAVEPLLNACSLVGLHVGRASIGPFSRTVAKGLIESLTSAQLKYELDIQGLDILVVPDSLDLSQVHLHILGAFAGALPTIVSPDNHFIQFQALSGWESMYKAMYNTCAEVGADRWINYHIDSVGVRLRQRVTSGCFYGQAAERLVNQASKLVRDSALLPLQLQCDVVSVETNIKAALEIAEQAAQHGDLQAASSAAQYAQAYAEDIQGKLLDAGAPVVGLALTLLSRFDLSGLTLSPVLLSVHDELMKQIASLPLPLERKTPVLWQCVEHAKVSGPRDIITLVKWARGEID